MNESTVPGSGANFSRLDLATVKQGLDTLRDDGDRNGGWLTPAQVLCFNRYVTAWNDYRANQPEPYQAEVERAISVILGYEVDQMAGAA